MDNRLIQDILVQLLKLDGSEFEISFCLILKLIWLKFKSMRLETLLMYLLINNITHSWLRNMNRLLM